MRPFLTQLPAAIAAITLAGCAMTPPTQDASAWKPKDPPMLTRWAKDIDPKLPRPEYPRPQLTRKDWQNLNGLWKYSVVPKGAAQPNTWDGRILVPYPIESALSGVKRAFLPDEVLYYQRNFNVPANWKSKRVILHFGAVDYITEVFVNGQRVGGHEGGYDPFSFDVTEQLRGDGEQELIVKVTDPTWTQGQPRGKQTLSPAGIMYTPTSGIWQTVWLEPVTEGGIERLHILPDVKGGAVKVTVDLYSNAAGEVTITVPGGPAVTGPAGAAITVPVKNPKLWTPEQPHLYDFTVEVARNGQRVDKVGSYFGMRSIEKAFIDGHQRVLLNGQPVFMFGPLDQGFWPDGCYTAPTDAALKYDLEVIKQLGFNTVRKHIKVEPARWYYYADKLGLLVWQDMPSANSYDTPPGGRPAVNAPAYETQFKALIKNLENHPAIVMWIVFNESQGKHDAVHLVKLAQELDPSRLVNEDSGHQDGGGRYEGVGDLFDEHPYPAPRGYNSPDARAFVLGEYGGIGLKLGNNPWQSKGWGYTTTKTSEELEDLYARYAGMLRQFKEKNGLVGAIYTQITDVEIEVNGLMTYDRQLKVDPKLIAKANRFEWSGPVFTSIVPNSEQAAPIYTYTFTKPAADWMMPGADTGGWPQGPGGFGTENTPGIGRIGTAWNTSDIWLRRTFTLPQLSRPQLDQLVLNLHHDDDVQVYLNGVLAYEKVGWESGYAQLPISAAARQTLNPCAENLIAIHCHQNTGGQYIDVGLGTLDRARLASAPSRPKPLQAPQHFARTVTQKQALDYLLFLPKNYSAKRAEGWPLILFLHGAGERGTNVLKVKAHGPPKQVETNPDFPCVLVSPQCPEGKTWDASELTGLLDAVVARHNIDTNRIYLTGLSMGGYGTWSLGLAHPERFAAIAPICGGGERRSVMQAVRSKGDIVRKLPIWAFHGAKDPVVPLAESETMVNALKNAGAQNVRLTVYPEAQHDSWTQTYDNPEFYQWLLAQKRQP